MEFTFRPLEIVCNRTLSSDESPWGSNDGIRLYFLVEMGLEAPEVMISGREYPPPDVVENYSMKAGDRIDLSAFPPEDRAGWTSRVFNVDEINLLKLSLIGMNEGLPYIAGGGGSGSATLGNAFTQGLMAIVGTPGAGVAGVAFDQVIDLADSLNNFPDCTGTAFIYKQELTGGELIAELLRSRGKKTLTFSRLQSLRSQPPLAGCSVPDYEVRLEIQLKSRLRIIDENSMTQIHEGEKEDYIPTFEFCARELGPMQVWALSFDRKIVFRPTFKFNVISLIWEINGLVINDISGTLQIPLDVTKQPGGKIVSETVPVGYKLDLDRVLTLSTWGLSGSYRLMVRALLQLHSGEPPFPIYSNHYYVHGQEMVGNENYQLYQKCVKWFFSKLNSYIFIPRLSPIDPISSPTIRFNEIEIRLKNMINLIKDLAGGTRDN